jgi:hypothetical protein
MNGMTRGPLPARVYWLRRLTVLGIATLLVIGIAQLLGGASDGSSGPDRAVRAAQTGPTASSGTTALSVPTYDPGSAATSGATTGTITGPRRHRARDTSTPTAMAMPNGPCAADDVAVTPSVPHPVAGSDIGLVLDLSTVSSPACYWHLSGRTLALRITSGSDLIWTTVQCAKAVPSQDVVLRNNQPTRVTVTWDAMRSEPGCPKLTAWALPGTYHLSVAALGGRPQEVTFQLTTPAPPEVTRTAHPHHGKKHRRAG